MLEPEGTVEIKFRTKDKVKIMSRLDQQCMQLQEKLKTPGLTPQERKETQEQLKEREEFLAPIYHQVS